MLPTMVLKPTNFRLEVEILRALAIIKERDGIATSEQVRRALLTWIESKGLTIKGEQIMSVTERATKDYEYRRGSIEVVDSRTGGMRCRECGSVWWSSLRHGGGYHRGSWTCHDCGANSKGSVSKKKE